MTLTTGAKLGPYEILAPLGAGGMGEVYRARDSRLGRDVALKVLPEAFAADAERMARFQREAKVLASLNHPNIATIHGLEESGGVRALVMELVEGPTVADRIAKGPIPVDEALPAAKQICEGLEYAHERGVIHRDLKPANVKITPEGTVKVLDFGLAKALDPAVAAISSSPSAAGTPGISPTLSPTLSIAATQAGVIMGTAAYMPPEQARGKPVERRADIWAFGCVLYEMLAGKQAFAGETATEVLAAVIMKDPEWGALSATTPSPIQRLLRRCLTKDPKQRLRDIGEARITIEEIISGIGADGVRPGEESAGGETLPLQSLLRRVLPWAVVAMILAGFPAAIWLWRRSSNRQQVARLVISLPTNQELTGPPAISPDGQCIAYTAREGTAQPELYLRNMDSFQARWVSGSEGAQQPFFSPDGRWVAFFAQGQLLKSALSGGLPIRIAAAPSATVLGGTWNKDNTIIFSPGMGSGLMRMPASGGPVETITKPNGDGAGYAHAWPQALPGGHSVLFTIWGKSVSGNAILSLDTGQWKLVLPRTGGAIYSPPGDLLVGDGHGELRAARFDPDHPAVVDADRRVLSDVVDYDDLEGLWLSVAQNGTVVYAAANPAARGLVWVDREGNALPVTQQQGRYTELALSPDGMKAAVKERYDLWIYDFRRGTHSRLTFQGSPRQDSTSPEWAPDGKHLIFACNSDGSWNIYSQLADGSQPAKLLLKGPYDKFPAWVAPDGTTLFAEANPATGEDLWALSPGGKASPWRVTQFNESNAVISPDGHWVAYDSDETGRDEIYIQSYPKGDRRFLVSNGGGWLPRFSGNSRELFYSAGDSFMVAPQRPDGSIGTPHRLFDRSQFLLQYNSYGVSPDGKKFLMIRRDPGSVPRQLNVILNWSEELKHLVPGNRK
jgi:eukaryotic-like serine/threonine-protein kinase